MLNHAREAALISDSSVDSEEWLLSLSYCSLAKFLLVTLGTTVEMAMTEAMTEAMAEAILEATLEVTLEAVSLAQTANARTFTTAATAL